MDHGPGCERKDVAGVTTLVLEFPKTAGDEMAGLSATEIEDASQQSGNSKALAGSHVLVIASRREVRVLIRDAIRNMSMLVDFVSSVEEAASFCREGLPHAIIVDSIQKGTRFTHFRDEILDEVPDFVFIEILEQGSTFEMSGTNGAQMARIGRDVVSSSLPAALMFELSRGALSVEVEVAAQAPRAPAERRLRLVVIPVAPPYRARMPITAAPTMSAPRPRSTRERTSGEASSRVEASGVR